MNCFYAKTIPYLCKTCIQTTKMKKNKFITLFVMLLTIALTIWGDSWAHDPSEQTVSEYLFSLQDIPDGWESLFDGKTLTGWKVVRYGGDGEPYVKDGSLVLPMAVSGPMTGVCWVGDVLPANNYIIYYEARRVRGSDIFAGLTFPYGDTAASLIFGGWGGIVNGLSSIGGFDASENETVQYFSYNNNQWYPVQLHVTPDSIRATVGKEKVIDLATAGKDIHLRDVILDTGLTLWNFNSAGEIRNIRIKKMQ